jgi:hypothetical protein
MLPVDGRQVRSSEVNWQQDACLQNLSVNVEGKAVALHNM